MDAKSPVVGLAHSRMFAYVATRSRNLVRYRSDQWINGQDVDEVSMVNVIPESIVKMISVVVEKLYYLIIQGETNAYVLEEAMFPRKPAKKLDINKPVKAISDIPGSPSFLVADADNISRFLIKDGEAVIVGSRAHEIRGISNMLASFTRVLAWEKKGECCVFDTEFKTASRETLEVPIRTCAAVEGGEGFLGVLKDNQLLQMGHVLETAVAMPEDVIAMGVRVPYAYILSPKSFSVYTTVANLSETITLSAKPKHAMLEVLDDHSVLYSSDSQVTLVQCAHPGYHVKMLVQQRAWRAGIALRTGLAPDIADAETLPILYGRYGDDLLAEGKYREAFDAFKKSRRPSLEMIREFGAFLRIKGFKAEAKQDLQEHMKLVNKVKELLTARALPKDIVKAICDVRVHRMDKTKAPPVTYVIDHHNQIKRECVDDLKRSNQATNEIEQLFQASGRIVPRDGQATIASLKSGPAVAELATLVRQSLVGERQATKVKILNTVLLQCLAGNGSADVRKFIDGNPPLFFNVAAETLKEAHAEDEFLRLCEQHHKHDDAIRYLHESDSTDQHAVLVKYIARSLDCMKIAHGQVQPLYAALVKTMDSNAAAEQAVEAFFSKLLIEEDTVEKVIAFIGQLDETPASAKRIMEIKLLEFVIFELDVARDSLHMRLIDIYFEALRIDVEADSSKAENLRKSLRRVLDESLHYDPDRVIAKIPAQFLEEKLSVLRRQNRIDQCIELVTAPEVDISVALDFCDKAYTQYTCIYNELFFQIIRRRHGNEIDKIKALLNCRGECIDPRQIIENIPRGITVIEIKEFLCRLSRARVDGVRSLAIRNSLISAMIEAKREQLRYLCGGHVRVGRNLSCIVCGRPIGESVFYVRSDNGVTHAACNMDQ